jgi:hypothetical protein
MEDSRRSIVIKEHGRKHSTCYVTTFQGPLSVWNAFHRGAYVESTQAQAMFWPIMRERGLRWGAYGDPAALPLELLEYYHDRGQNWRELQRVSRWTGYTHQWRRDDVQGFRPYLMASTDTLEESSQAQAMGWRTFRVEHEREREDFRGIGETICPASPEGDSRSDCQSCGLCNGAHGRSGTLEDVPAGITLPRLPKGIVLYRGPSRLDGAPIVCVATGFRSPSDNPKTGPMVQTWIMREDVAPHTAQKTGEDSSVCGDCPLRPLLKGARLPLETL